jgi:hypothetical protein
MPIMGLEPKIVQIRTVTLSEVASAKPNTHNTSPVALTLILLMYISYMELLVKPEILTSYVYGPTFGKAESRLFLFSAQCFNTESMQKVILCHSCV